MLLQQTLDVHAMIKCWANVVDDEPTLSQHREGDQRLSTVKFTFSVEIGWGGAERPPPPKPTLSCTS